MPTRVPEIAPAFRRLRRALIVRRLQRLDPVLRLELALIGALVAGFFTWRARLPLDHLARLHGTAWVAGALSGGLAACAGLGGMLAGADHWRRLHRPPAGPEWLALPIPPGPLARHLAWESGLHALWVLPVAAGLVAASWGLVPWWSLGLLAAGFLAALPVAGRAGCAPAWWLATRRHPPAPAGRPARHALERLLSQVRVAPAVRLPAARFGGGVARALLLKDLARSLRRTPARPRAAAWLALLLVAAAVWVLPLEAPAAAALSAALALVAAAALAGWMISLSAGDPYALLAALPLRAHRVWALRLGLVAVAAAATTMVLAVAARPLEPLARGQVVASLGLATLLIGALGVTYGVTLFPRAEVARRLVTLWLALALAGSLMFPLAGWLILLGALIHALRRLRRCMTLAADVAAGPV